MKKVNLNTHYNKLKEAAKELNLKFVGIKKEVLVQSINDKIDEMKASKPAPTRGKWHEQENAFPYEVGQVVIINETYRYPGIHNRLVEIVGPSTKRNALKGHLINPLNGQKQKTCISLDFADIELLNEAVKNWVTQPQENEINEIEKGA